MQVVQADEAVANAAAQEAQAIKVLQYRLFHNNSFRLDFGKPLIKSLRSIDRVTEFQLTKLTRSVNLLRVFTC